MRILIVNDDGIASPALANLAAFAGSIGNDVTVAAPLYEQSGKSQAIHFSREIEIKKVDFAGGLPAYSVDSTPADCVRFGTVGLGNQYDLILSGINRGYNLGDDIVYSGTIGAIFEGARMDIMGIAFSADPDTFDKVHVHLPTIFDFFEKHKLLSHHCLYNVNIPPVVKGIRITRQGGVYFSDEFVHCGGDMYRQEGGIVVNEKPDLDTDIDAVNAGYISITPLSVKRTDMETFEELKHLN